MILKKDGMLDFFNQLAIVVAMLSGLSYVAAHALIRLPFGMSEWWTTFSGCFVVIWLLLDNVSLCAEINALRAVGVSIEESNKTLMEQLEKMEKHGESGVIQAQRRGLVRIHWMLMANKARALYYIAASWKVKQEQGMRRWGSSKW